MTTTFRDYTLERYNVTMARVRAYRGHFAVMTLFIVGVTAVLSFLFAKDATLADFYGRATFSPVEWVVVLWLVPLPIMLWKGYTYVRYFKPRPLTYDGSAGRGHRVIFQITTTGQEAETVKNTVESVLYWKQRLAPSFSCEVQVVMEPSGYDAHAGLYELLAHRGINFLVVPSSYRTPNDSVRKSRALQYAVKMRQEWRYNLERTWVYHHDDETAIGEDTFAGIARFLAENGQDACLGTGIILYPQEMDDWRPSAVADLNRTKDDITSLYSLTHSNRASQFHGSHYLVRADVEAAVGFDMGPKLSLIDDLTFEVRMRKRYGDRAIRVLEGFAYEMSPQTWRDQIRQRRRWVIGLKTAETDLDMPVVRKLSMLYYITAWAMGSASTFTVAMPLVFNFDSVLPFGLSFAAASWGLMIWGYVVGYTFHREYVSAPRPLWRVVKNGIVGAGVDAVAVWVGLAARNNGSFKVVSKDRKR